MTEGLLSAVEVDCTADVGEAGVGMKRQDYALRRNRFFGVLIAPRKNVTNRACGPIWLNSDANGVAKEGASK
jgi:hypothetical protein